MTGMLRYNLTHSSAGDAKERLLDLRRARGASNENSRGLHGLC